MVTTCWRGHCIEVMAPTEGKGKGAFGGSLSSFQGIPPVVIACLRHIEKSAFPFTLAPQPTPLTPRERLA